MHINDTIERQAALLVSNNREMILDWLQWNDPKGCYTDDLAEDEGFPPMELVHAKHAMIRALMDKAIPEGEGMPKLIAEAISLRPEHFPRCWGDWADLCASDDFA